MSPQAGRTVALGHACYPGMHDKAVLLHVTQYVGVCCLLIDCCIRIAMMARLLGLASLASLRLLRGDSPVCHDTD
jgi:hypothetical protein